MKETEERLENALLHQPNRYISTRDKEGKLIEVADRDSGRVWIKVKKGWVWIE